MRTRNPFETHPADKIFYSIKNMYYLDREAKNRVFNPAHAAKFTTKPDSEVRWNI